jgi:hypothetical protein
MRPQPHVLSALLAGRRGLRQPALCDAHDLQRPPDVSSASVNVNGSFDQECAERGTNKDGDEVVCTWGCHAIVVAAYARISVMDARRILALLVLGGCAGAGPACSGSLATEPMRLSGAGGATRDAGAGTGGSTGATDARVKADRMCQDDVDAVPASVDGGADPCTFLVSYPTACYGIA